MADENKIEYLMLEQFRAVRSDIAKVAEDIRNLKTEITAVRHHVRGIEVQQDGHGDEIAGIKVRLERLERRLELTDQS